MKKLFEKLKTAVGRDGVRGSVLTALILAALILFNATVYALDERYGLYLYQPVSDDLSVSEGGETYFARPMAEGKHVTILFCQPEEDVEATKADSLRSGYYVLQTARNLAEKYPEFITLQFVNIIADPAAVEPYRTDGETILRTSVIFIGEGDNFAQYKTVTSSAYASFFSLNAAGQVLCYNGEEIMSSMILWTMTDVHPTAYFTSGHSETSDTSFLNQLICAGYNVNLINLREYADGTIPADAGLVVISAPKNDFSRAAEGSGVLGEIEWLERYLSQGGNLYVSLDPNLKQPLPFLEGFLNGHGITMRRAVGEHGETPCYVLRDRTEAITSDFYTIVAAYADNAAARTVGDTVNAYGNGGVLLTGVGVLDVSGEASALLMSSSTAEIYAMGERFETGAFCIAASAETADGGHLFVIPSIYLAAGDALATNGYANRDFLLAVCEKVFGGMSPAYGCRVISASSSMLENLTMAEARAYTAFLMAIPLVTALVGLAVVYRRRNR